MDENKKAADRGDDRAACQNVRAGQRDDTTRRTAIHRLPRSVHDRYLVDRAIWQTIYAHHRAIMRLRRAAA